MPHCSSEHEEEQFESMVGGSALKRALTVPPPPQSSTIASAPVTGPFNNSHLKKMDEDKEFTGILNEIRLFQRKFPQDGVVQGCGGASLCVYTDRWVSLSKFNEDYRSAEGQVDETKLRNAIQEMEEKIGIQISIDMQNILASIILQSPNEELLNKTSQKCPGDYWASVAVLDITTSIVAKLSEHFELEQLQGLLKNMVDKWKDSVGIVINSLAKLKLGKFFSGTTKNIIQLLIQTKLIGVTYQLAHYLTCYNTHIRIFAGYAMLLLLLRCLKELIKQATPSNESIRNLETNMDNFISSRNEHIDSIVDDLDSNLPAPKIKEKIKEFREFISTGKTGNLANDAYIDAALNACTALEVPLNEINALSKSAVDTEKLENIKSMLMKITTGWNETSELSSGAAEAAHPMEPVEENDPKKLYARAVEENDPKTIRTSKRIKRTRGTNRTWRWRWWDVSRRNESTSRRIDSTSRSIRSRSITSSRRRKKSTEKNNKKKANKTTRSKIRKKKKNEARRRPQTHYQKAHQESKIQDVKRKVQETSYKSQKEQENRQKGSLSSIVQKVKEK